LRNQLHRREGDYCIISSSPNIQNITYRSSTEIPAILEVTHILILPHFLNKFNDDNAENKVSLESITQEIICSSIPVQRDVAITWDMLREGEVIAFIAP